MQEKTQYIGCGKVKKVMVIKTSEEVKQARIRERQQQRYLAAQRTLLQAVEQAVTLPDPTPPIPCEQEQATEETPYSEATEKANDTPPLKVKAERVLGSIASFVDRMRNFVLEEG